MSDWKIWFKRIEDRRIAERDALKRENTAEARYRDEVEKERKAVLKELRPRLSRVVIEFTKAMKWRLILNHTRSCLAYVVTSASSNLSLEEAHTKGGIVVQTWPIRPYWAQVDEIAVGGKRYHFSTSPEVSFPILGIAISNAHLLREDKLPVDAKQFDRANGFLSTGYYFAHAEDAESHSWYYSDWEYLHGSRRQSDVFLCYYLPLNEFDESRLAKALVEFWEYLHSL